MSTAVAHNIASIRTELEALSNNSGTLYLSLGRNLPQLLQELDHGFVEPRQIIGSFVESEIDVAGTEQRNETAEIMRWMRDVGTEASTFFADMRQRDAEVSGALLESVAQLARLEVKIGKIRDSSTEMEVMSLNAMVTAIKSGRSGRAFSYVTDELRRLASRTITSADSISAHGKETLDHFSEFTKLLSDADRTDEAFYVDFDAELSASFQHHQEEAQSIAEGLSAIIARAEEVRQPLSEIMAEMQRQDIIRQGVDHVLVSLAQLDEELPEDNSDASLDVISFHEHVTELCALMLDDIKAKLVRSIALFRENLSRIKDVLDQTESDRVSFIASVTSESNNSNEENDSGAPGAFFVESADVLTGLSAHIEGAKRSKEEVIRETATIIQGLSALKDSFELFEKLIGKFYPIRVLLQLEIAKQALLQQGITTVEEMTDLTNKINVERDESLRIIRDVMKQTSDSVQSYSAVGRKEIDSAEQIVRRIAQINDRFADIGSNMARSLASFSPYSSRFLSVLETSGRDIEGLDQLVSEMGAIHSKVDMRCAEIKEMKARLLAARGIVTWEIRDTRMRQLIERFTLIEHKQSAASVAGFDVKTGDAEGQLTIFGE